MDETSPRPSKPQIGRRLLGRQATIARASGLQLGRSVAARHGKPEPVRAAMRLVLQPAGIDGDAAVASGTPFMGGAAVAPPTPTPEEKRLARIARGGPEVARAQKIFEGDAAPPRSAGPGPQLSPVEGPPAA